MEVFENVRMFDNEFHKRRAMWTHKSGQFSVASDYQVDQRELTKWDVLASSFLQKRSNVIG